MAVPGIMTRVELDDLMARMASSSADDIEDAAHSLRRMGPDIVPALAERIETFDRYGQLTAIDLFDDLGDPRAGPVLVRLTRSPHDTVREWAAGVIGALGYRDGAPAVRALADRYVADRVPPNWTGPCIARAALVRLGARVPFIPAATAAALVRTDRLPRIPVTSLPLVIDDLADHDQVVLGFQTWFESGDTLFGRAHESIHWQYEWDAPWADNVEQAREAAQLDASCVRSEDELVASLEWIARSDVDDSA